MIKNENEAVAAYDWIDLTGLRPIIFDVLGVFLHVQIHLEVSTKKFGSAGILGLPYDVIKTLKLQYFLNGMCYEGGWTLIGKEIRYEM